MTSDTPTARQEPTLQEQLRTKSHMMNMGEHIEWGSDTALMDEAVFALDAAQAQIAELEAQSPTTPPDVAQAARVLQLEAIAKAAFGLVCHPQWGTHQYTDMGMWADAQKLKDALDKLTDPPASDTRSAPSATRE